ncbi:sigma factor-like helix-turn-helix DNA-binding protein [Sedimentibacter sp.]|nr:sigma factor-like helix-turn-helix DNA-binding protein [Sedimentibacter sp.]
MKTLNLSKLKKLEEKAFEKYIYLSIKHEYIRLSKKNFYINSHEVLSDIDIIDYIDQKQLESPTKNIEIINTLNCLSKKQKRVFTCIFIYGYSDTETAQIIGVSKQAIGRMRKRIAARIKEENN